MTSWGQNKEENSADPWGAAPPIDSNAGISAWGSDQKQESTWGANEPPKDDLSSSNTKPSPV
jgi:hypothetical protein